LASASSRQPHDDERQLTFVCEPPVGQQTSFRLQLRSHRSQCDLEHPRHKRFPQQIPTSSGGGLSGQS